MSDVERKRPSQHPAERGIRDLMGLLALSALWLGKDGLTVLEQMMEAVERLVPIQFAFAEACVLPGESLTALGRVGGRALSNMELASWRLAANSWPASVISSSRGIAPKITPIGELKIVRMELGVSTLRGGVWFGADRPDFPTTTELAILRAASSLAATSIQAAKLQYERDSSDRAKDEFLAMLGHELRNPLAPIRTGASMLLMDDITLPQVKKTAAVLDRQVRHMTGLVDSLLDVSRLSTGAVILAEDIVDMKKVVHDAYEQIFPFFDAKSHTVTIEIPKEDAFVFGDISRLVQVLSNLLNNAAKYTAPGGSISVLLEVQQDVIVLTVADNGTGIDAPMLSKVFELFTQAKRSSDRFGGGLGVGLALAKRLVDLHEGKLTAQSEGLGRGASFEMKLKRLNAPAERPLQRLEALPAVSPEVPLRILVVDDNVDAADMLSEMLKIFGHEVVTANHPIKALKLALEIRPDVYILDIGLPEIDGYELARRLKALPELGRYSLVALTGYGQAEDQEKAYIAGFNFHCVKPIDLGNLMTILSEISTQAKSFIVGASS